MESVGRNRKCLNRKNPQKPHELLTKLNVSQTNFASYLMKFDEFDICYGAANKVVKQDLNNICSKEVLGKDMKLVC